MDFQLRPIIKSMCVNKARMVSIHAVSEAVLEDMQSNEDIYHNIINTERGPGGDVLAITSDIQKMNQLKAKVSMLIQNKILDFQTKYLSIPLGTLTGMEMFSGRGPQVPFKITVTGSVVTEFKSNFSDAGINQTRHQIYLEVHTKISALIPGYSSSFDFDTNILVAETVIVGKVPNIYSTNGTSEIGHLTNASTG